ncbi:MAG: hypothetical protein LBR80_04620 [Deltaproteobacteria bacterium]|nr:hypothetical protein [Deltaproteobacteria bacterium]
MVTINKDLSNVEPQRFYGTVPEAEYEIRLADSREYSGERSSGVILEWEIALGDYAGTVVSDVIVLEGSEQAVTFGAAKLKDIALAVGFRSPEYIRDTEELHGLVCRCKIGFGRKGSAYEAKNQISRYWRKKTAQDPPSAQARARRDPSPAQAPAQSDPPPAAPRDVAPQSVRRDPPPAERPAPAPEAAQPPAEPWEAHPNGARNYFDQQGQPDAPLPPSNGGAGQS